MFSLEICEIFKKIYFENIRERLLLLVIAHDLNRQKIKYPLVDVTWGHLLSTYAKFSENLAVHTCAYQGVWIASFSENFAYVLSKWWSINKLFCGKFQYQTADVINQLPLLRSIPYINFNFIPSQVIENWGD